MALNNSSIGVTFLWVVGIPRDDVTQYGGPDTSLSEFRKLPDGVEFNLPRSIRSIKKYMGFGHHSLSARGKGS